MNAGVDEVAYAAALRRSARETVRRFQEGDFAEERRIWGSLQAAVRGELDTTPKTVEAISCRVGKGKGNVICALRRLEECGKAARSGTTRNARGQPVTLWIRGPAA